MLESINNINKIDYDSVISARNSMPINPVTANKPRRNSVSSLDKSSKIQQMKRMIDGTEKKEEVGINRIIKDTLSQSKLLKEQRANSKDTASTLKQLNYNYKSISSQLTRSKTSVSAKQVASKARREVVKLKQKLLTGKYDKEELEAAIDHAKAMERAANKKARHLTEEEMVKITDEANGSNEVSELEDRIEEKQKEIYDSYDEAVKGEFSDEIETISEEQACKMEEQIRESMEETREMMEASMEESIEEMSDDMMSLLMEAMEEITEDTLSQLSDQLLSIPDLEMTRDEFKVYTTKHRTSEDKDMLEADAKYLKAIFDKYQRELKGGGGAIPSGAGMSFGSQTAGDVFSGGAIDFSSGANVCIDISL